ncbi:hypothetical protein MUK42_01511, partial [Musa troglodytarum]
LLSALLLPAHRHQGLRRLQISAPQVQSRLHPRPFSTNQQQQFLNSHRHFGLSNVIKIIRNLDPYQRSEAMKAIVFQSDMRALDPVGGCYRIIRDSNELALVLRQLAVCRAQAMASGFPTVAPDLEVSPNTSINRTRVNNDNNNNVNSNDILSLQRDRHQQ